MFFAAFRISCIKMARLVDGDELPTHAWSGTEKTVAQLVEERRLFVTSLPPSQVVARSTGRVQGAKNEISHQPMASSFSLQADHKLKMRHLLVWI